MKILPIAMCAVCLLTYGIDMEKIIDKTVEKYENLNSFYAEFQQTLCDESSGMCMSYEGKIYYLKPNFFRLEMDDPKQIYVGDSVSLWIYIPSKKKAIRQSLGEVPFHINPDMFLKNYKERFNAELTGEEGDYVYITLTPKKQTEIYNNIVIKIHKDKFEIAGINVTDAAGQENKFDFEKIEMNKKLSKELFHFAPPEGTKIDEY